MEREGLRFEYEQRFPMWMKAVIQYCKETQIRSTSLQSETSKFKVNMDEGKCKNVCVSTNVYTWGHKFFVGDCAMMGLRCLALLLIPMKNKQMDDNIPFITKVVPVSCVLAEHRVQILSWLSSWRSVEGVVKTKDYM